MGEINYGHKRVSPKMTVRVVRAVSDYKAKFRQTGLRAEVRRRRILRFLDTATPREQAAYYAAIDAFVRGIPPVPMREEEMEPHPLPDFDWPGSES